ncbi:MAG: MMPL family transporter [Deltaproteobacteria bacterium]|nr:MMPL family transporter [Deltaproteobacteria bacterium]
MNINRVLIRFIKMNQRFWRWFIFACVVLIAAGVHFGTHIRLDTDLSRLLPQKSKSVQDLKIIQGKAGGSHDLRLVLEGGPLEDRLKAVTAFSEYLSQKPDLVRSVRFKTPKSFLEKYKYQLVPIESLKAIHQRVLKEREKYDDWLDPLNLQSAPEPQATSAGATQPDTEKKDLDQAKQLLSQLENMRPFYQTEDGSYLALRIVPAGENLDIEKNRKILNRFEQEVKDFNFSQFNPEIKTSIYGSIPDHISRFDSIAADVRFGGYGIILILLLVAFYFRNFWALLVLTPPLVVGLAVGLSVTFFLERTLNSITVFLILVVFGMGIEFGIHLWARFLDERKKISAFDSLIETWQTTGRATITSTLALFAGYGLLAFSSFQGFAQFGRVAMILVSAVALSFLFFMPSWIFLVESLRGQKSWPSSLPIYLQDLNSRGRLKFPRIPHLAKSLRVLSIALGVGGAILCAISLRFDYQFDDAAPNKPRPKSKEALGHIFTERLKPSALAVFSNPEEANQFVNYFESHREEYPDIPLVSSLNSFLPADRDARIEKLNEIADDIEYSWLKKVEDPDVKKALREIKDQASSFKPLQLEDLPPEMREPFIASDKSGDLLVYLYDKGGETDGRKAIGFSNAVSRLEDQTKFHPPLSGQEIIFAEVVKRVIQEGPWLVLGMLVFVFGICWLDFRRLNHAVYSIAPVLLGFLITGAVLVLSRVQINFYNMIAIASLGSMVIDNSIHLYHRYLENKETGVREPAKRATFSVSPTIIICTMTSILGYGGMLFANHAGVASLGFVATVGLFCCLISSIIFFPAWLMLNEEKAAR